MAAHTFKRFVRHAIIRSGLEAIALSPAGRMARGSGRSVIFTLHHVRPRHPGIFEPNAHLSITPDFLEQAILTVRELGMETVALQDLPERLASSGPEQSFACFTLDDGYRDNRDIAAPVFRKHDVPFTIFITAGFAERSRSIWWETAERLVTSSPAFVFDFGNGSETVRTQGRLQQAIAFDRLVSFINTGDEDAAIAKLDAAAERAGVSPLGIVEELVMSVAELSEIAKDPLISLGAHTLTHPNLRLVSGERLKNEIEGSVSALEAYTGKRPTTFAYPYGISEAVGEREIKAAAEAGLAAAVTGFPGLLEAGAIADPCALPRVSLNGYYQKPRLLKALLSGIPFKLTGRTQPVG